MVSLESEEREACTDCRVQLVHQEKPELRELRAAKDLLVELVCPEPLVHEEMLDQRVSSGKRDPLERMVF